MVCEVKRSLFNADHLPIGNHADDLLDYFDFGQKPLTYGTIAAPHKADYFLNDRRAPTDPDDD
jgi:hypothetical protein